MSISDSNVIDMIDIPSDDPTTVLINDASVIPSSLRGSR